MRLWLKPWIWARWPCADCGAWLRFDQRRRFLAAILSPFALVAGFGAGALVMPWWGNATAIGVGAAVMMVVLIPIFMLDAVTLA